MMRFPWNSREISDHWLVNFSFNLQANASKKVKYHVLKNKQSLHLLKRKEKIDPFWKTGARFPL